MAHHIGNETTSLRWTRVCNDLIHRVCGLYPDNFVGVCQLPQSPGVPPVHSAAELERCVERARIHRLQSESRILPADIGIRRRSPTGHWYPLYEKMVELDVPAMVHVSSSCNPNFHATGAHYINADTTAFMQFLTSTCSRIFQPCASSSRTVAAQCRITGADIGDWHRT